MEGTLTHVVKTRATQLPNVVFDDNCLVCPMILSVSQAMEVFLYGIDGCLIGLMNINLGSARFKEFSSVTAVARKECQRHFQMEMSSRSTRAASPGSFLQQLAVPKSHDVFCLREFTCCCLIIPMSGFYLLNVVPQGFKICFVNSKHVLCLVCFLTLCQQVKYQIESIWNLIFQCMFDIRLFTLPTRSLPCAYWMMMDRAASKYVVEVWRTTGSRGQADFLQLYISYKCGYTVLVCDLEKITEKTPVHGNGLLVGRIRKMHNSSSNI